MNAQRSGGNGGRRRDALRLATTAGAGETRGDRRKRSTRRRLLQAALQLIGERGIDAVAINEITELADVGFGSFYNHFDSKEAIYQALVEELYDDYQRVLAQIGATVRDPAEVLGASVRYGVQRAIDEPDWGRLMVRLGFSLEVLDHGLASGLRQDLLLGAESGRFRIDDPLFTYVSIGCTLLGAIRIASELGDSQGRGTFCPGQAQIEAGELIERLVVYLLGSLGLARTEALEIARRALPDIESVTI